MNTKLCGNCGHYRGHHHYDDKDSTCLVHHKDHYGLSAFTAQGYLDGSGKGFCSCLKFNPKPRFEILVSEALNDNDI